MAGVNLNEENARILATSSELVGTKIRSCKDESFLPTDLLHRRMLDTGLSAPYAVFFFPSVRVLRPTVSLFICLSRFIKNGSVLIPDSQPQLRSSV